MTIPFNPFYFIRHGQTDWNHEHRLQGQTDIQLNRFGISQAHEAAAVLYEAPFVSIAASPLSRAVKTAEIIAQERNVSLHLIQELKECSLGVKEGQLRSDKQWYENWLQGEQIESAESFSAFTARVMQGLTIALKLPGPVLVVAHSFVYHVIQKELGLPPMELSHCQPVYHQPPKHPTHPWQRYSLKSQDDDDYT
jgi:Fructose-2,6-bisphosphatase